MRTLLTKRELEIVTAVIYHGSKKEAAAALYISPYTVETTIKNVYERLGLNKISDLTLWFCAIKFGIEKEINEFKKSVLPVLIASLIIAEGIRVNLNNEDLVMYRTEITQRSTRRRRRSSVIRITSIQVYYNAA